MKPIPESRKPILDVDTDEYMSDQKSYEQISEMGVEVHPVDLNDAYVAIDKYGKDNLEETEENIHRRFNLKPKEE